MNELSSSPTSLLFLQAAKHTALPARQTFNHFPRSASSAVLGDGLLPGPSNGQNHHTRTFISHASCGLRTRTGTKRGNRLL